MNKVEQKCFAALYGSGEVPGPDEVKEAQAASTMRPDESEWNHQRRLHVWLTRLGVPHYHPPNELVRTEAEGRSQKMIGLSPGVPDIVIPMARKPHHGLYIELKALPHGKVSGAQEWWLKTLLNENYLAVVSWSFEESVKIVKDYLALPLWGHPILVINEHSLSNRT